LRRRVRYEDFIAIDSLSLTVRKGEALGVIGRNGSGKSTLLKIIGGVYRPTAGSVWVEGKLAPLIELGAGFNPELTGRENVFLNGAILGYSKREMQQKFEHIVDFAEMWSFIDSPLKSYSSGMVMRLGFAAGTHADPDILLIDEILAVGDADFQRKCIGRLHDFRKGGKTIVFVSHNIKLVREMCHRVIVLERGRIIADGNPDEAIAVYRQHVEGVASCAVAHHLGLLF
jgi:ABC-type polysaccharide/polyol phosphate transport system ATPase subunit